MKPFQIISNGKIFDYRFGQPLNQEEISSYFRNKGYDVVKIWFGNRHELGIFEKNNKKYLLKLATTEGQSVVLENEIFWNQEVNIKNKNNRLFEVPKVCESGKFKEKFVWEITDFFEGEPLSNYPNSKSAVLLRQHLSKVVGIIEIIQNLKISSLPLDNEQFLLNSDSEITNIDASQKQTEKAKISFFIKTKSWLDAIPQDIFKKYNIKDLFKIVERGFKNLKIKPRHGDFTPWHMVLLSSGKIGLIDGEHAMSRGVENYDLAYLLQRVWCVLENRELAEEIFNYFCRKNITIGKNKKEMQVVFASRSIGGFLDESMALYPNYKFHEEFMKWILNFC